MDVKIQVGDIIIPLSEEEALMLGAAIQDRLLPDLYEHRVEDEPEAVYENTRHIEVWEFIQKALAVYGSAEEYHRHYVKG